jgi:hypothetical protein
MVAKTKNYIDWKNRPYAASRSDDTRATCRALGILL